MVKGQLKDNLLRLRIGLGYSQEKIAELADISLLTYRKLESQECNPSLQTLQNLASAFNVSINDLFLPSKKIANIRFRALKTVKKREEIIFSVSNWLNNYNKLANKLKVSDTYKLSNLHSKTKDPIKMAELARKELGLKENEPIIDICGLLEIRGGIKICAKKFNSDAFFGLSANEDDNNKVIVVNTWNRITAERMIFSIAHELGHILLHLDSFQNDIDIENEQEEKEANEFASYFLMPEKAFVNEWMNYSNCDFVDRVIKIKHVFRISYKAVLYRLKKYLSASSDKTIWQLFDEAYAIKKPNSPKLGIKDEIEPMNDLTIEVEGIPVDLESGLKYYGLVQKAYQKKIINNNDVANLLGLVSNSTTIDNIIRLWDSKNIDNILKIDDQK